MLLDIVIPSLNRIQKLEQCLNSIFLSKGVQDEINIYLYFSLDKDYDYFYNTLKDVPNIFIRKIDAYRVPTFWNTHLKATKADALLTGNDDIEFFDNTLTKVCEVFKKDFPDNDGVLGLSQSNLPEGQALEGAFSVIGFKFADRFPNRQVFCPEYKRFRADYELMMFAKSVGKFKFYKDIKIQHHHPAFNRQLLDSTHHNVRNHLPYDNETFNQRQTKGLLWGQTWELINA